MIYIICHCLPALAQNEQKTFWALNGSPTGFVWDSLANNNRIDNGNGTWNSSNKTWTFNKGITDIIWRSGAAAIFGGNPGSGAAGAVTVTGTQTAHSLTFNPAASGTFRLSGGTITNNSGNIFANASASIGSTLAGSSGLTLTGTGTITLTTLSTYTGATTINSGTLVLSNGTAGSTTPTLTTPIVIASGGTLAADILSANINLSGNISGPGTLTMTSSPNQGQTFRLYGSNSGFTGVFTGPANGRGLMWSDDAGTGNAANTGSAAAAWNIGNSFGFIETVGAATPTVQLGSLSGTNTSTTLGGFGGTGTKTFQIGALNTSTSFAGAIQDNPQTTGSPVIALTKVGSGTLTLSGANTYSGATNVNAGTLTFGVNPSSTLWNITVNATGAPNITNSGTMNVPGALLSGLTKTVNIVVTGTSTGFTWTALTYSSLNLLPPTLQVNGTTVGSGGTVNGTKVTISGTTILVQR